jgi:ribosomal protein L24E
VLYTADEEGKLFSFHEESGFDGPLDKAMLTPVGPMAVANDGRVFGFCGTEISKLFCLDPLARKVAPLGSAASIMEQRRYGYQFGDAITGRDGEIIFGENDNGGHLWLYFPRIIPVTAIK